MTRKSKHTRLTGVHKLIKLIGWPVYIRIFFLPLKELNYPQAFKDFNTQTPAFLRIN
jgi:hypothetical protein